jgi:NADH dehydrogenase [ubiquinone] 1 alpha subcomplex assembly factor 7
MHVLILCFDHLFFAVLQQNYSSILEDSRKHIEVRLDEIEILDNLTKRLDSCGGFATIIDYGHDGTKEDTFRAFYKHKLHDPLVEPGKADLTSDVDFSFIKKLLGNRAMICGPATQRDYFSKIGIEHRLKVDLCTGPK